MSAAVLLAVLIAITCVQAQDEGNDEAQIEDWCTIQMMVSQIKTEMDDKITSLQEKVATQQKEIDELKKGGRLVQASNHVEGFNLRSIKEVSTSRAMIFAYTDINLDNSYNETTGVFTCKTPGHYYFFASLMTASGYSNPSYCYIAKNNVSLVKALARTSGAVYTAAVASMYVHLTAGDTVRLMGCSDTASWHTHDISSTFNSFLVTPDAA